MPPRFTPIQLDLRAESEIVSNLLRYRPAISENNIWVIWDGGWVECDHGAENIEKVRSMH
jgi:hypothetical protein